MAFDWSNLEAQLVQQVPAVLAVLESSAKNIINKLASVSVEAATSAGDLLLSIQDTAQKVVTGVLVPDDAKAATASLWEAFKLVGLTVTEKDKRAVFDEAHIAIAKIENIAFGMLGGFGSLILKGIA